MRTNPISGNTPGLPAISRRTLFGAVPLTLIPAAALAACSPAHADVIDPHPEWLAAWRLAGPEWEEECERTSDTSPTANAIWDRRTALEKAIYETPAQTKAGVIAQLEWVLADSVGDFACVGHEPAVRLILDTLHRL